MYTQILKDDDIYSIIAGIFETKRNCEVIDIKDLKISKDEQTRAKGRVMYKTNKGKFAEDITAVFEDFYCCIVSPNSVWITKKPYAEIMIDLLNEYEKEFDLSSENYKKDYNAYIRRQRRLKINEAKRQLKAAEQDYKEELLQAEAMFEENKI